MSAESSEKTKENMSIQHPKLNHSIFSKQHAPAEVWAACHQCHFKWWHFISVMRNVIDFSSAMNEAQIFIPLLGLLDRPAFSLVSVVSSCSESYYLFDFVLKVTSHVRQSCEDFAESLVKSNHRCWVSFIDTYIHFDK